MVEIFKMPDIGEGMAEGEIANWLIKVGDDVKEEQPIVEIQNDKLLQEVLSPISGKVTKIYVEAGTLCKVGEPLVEFDGDGSSSLESVTETATGSSICEESKNNKEIEKNKNENIKENEVSSNTINSISEILAVPSVRRYAYENNINLSNVTPTGSKGHITMDDVKNFNNEMQNISYHDETSQEKHSSVTSIDTKETIVDSNLTTKEEQLSVIGKKVPMGATRIAISKAMVNSKSKIPHVTLFDTVEVSKLVSHRQEAKGFFQEQGVKLTYMPYVIKALVEVLRKFPVFNSKIEDKTSSIVYSNEYNIGIATNANGELYVPVIKNADDKSMMKIAKELGENTKLVFEGKLPSDKMRGGSISITNLGSLGGSFFTPIINYPEVAILGIGTIHKSPIVDNDGNIIVGNILDISLSFDHRIIDGALAQEAVNELKRLLSNPDILLMGV